MANAKIERIDKAIEKTRAQLAELRRKLRQLEQQKKDIEDDEIIEFVRSEHISDAELNNLIRSIRDGRKNKIPAATRKEEHSRLRQEEPHNARNDEE